MNNKEKFFSIVSKEDTNTLGRLEERITNRDSRRIAFDIALTILDRLDQLGWSQKRLAEELGVSPQLVNKWVRGKENFTIETLVKIGKTLNTSFIEVPHSTIEKSVHSTTSGLKLSKQHGVSEALYSLKKKLNLHSSDRYHTFVHYASLNIAAEPSAAYISKASNPLASKPIDFFVATVSVHQFETFEAKSPAEKEIDVIMLLGYAIQNEQHAITCTLKYEMIGADQPLLKFEVMCLYTIEIADWNTLLNGNKFIIPSYFARHLGVITSGIARGVLHTNLENSHYKSYSIPLINTEDLPDEDILFVS